jgi:hypothetical protein
MMARRNQQVTEAVMLGRLGRLWRRWRHPDRPNDLPTLRLFFAPRAPWPSWHPTRGADGTVMMQIVVELEAANQTDRDIRIVRAHLRDHPAKQTSFTVGDKRGGHFAKDYPVKPHGRAHIMMMFFVCARRYAPGQSFSDVIVLGDDEGCEHRMKIGVRGR